MRFAEYPWKLVGVVDLHGLLWKTLPKPVKERRKRKRPHSSHAQCVVACNISLPPLRLSPLLPTRQYRIIHILIIIVLVSPTLSATMAVEKKSTLRFVEGDGVKLLEHIIDSSLALAFEFSITEVTLPSVAICENFV